MYQINKNYKKVDQKMNNFANVKKVWENVPKVEQVKIK